MKTFLFSLLAALVLAFPALARSEIVQKDTGGTVWEKGGGINEGDQFPAGDSGLTVLFRDLTTAATAYVISHKSGNVVKIYSVLTGAITAPNQEFDFHIGDGTRSKPISGTSALIITAVGSATGDIDSITYRIGLCGAETVGCTFAPNTAISQGDSIAIHGDGGAVEIGSGDDLNRDAVITIIIE